MTTRGIPNRSTLAAAMIDACWDFHVPAASQRRFASLLETPAIDPETRLELQTQLARALGLQSNFDQAQSILDDVAAKLTDATPIARVRHALEQGRVLNSSDKRDASRAHFQAAWDLASQHQPALDDLAVDAAHMLAIAHDPPESTEWIATAMRLCESSPNPIARRWKASLLNNAGWDAHAAADHERALDLFTQALTARQERGTPREIQIALWCVARALRSLNRTDQALAIQQQLAAGPAPDDGYVHEELAELLTTAGRSAEAAPHARRAHELLRDTLGADSPRLQRLAKLSN